MIDGIQLLTVFAACAYMGIGAIIGFIAALFIVSSYCIGHPIVLAWWARYRGEVEYRKGENELMNILKKKLQEARFDATREVLKKHFEEDIADIRKGHAAEKIDRELGL